MYDLNTITYRPVGLVFPHRAGRFRPGASPLSPVCRVVNGLEDFLSRDGNLSSPGCAGILYDSQSVSDRPVGLGFPHRAGRFRPGGSPFSSPRCGRCRCMEGFLIREWDPVLPGWRWVYFRAPANQRLAGGVGVSTPCGAVPTRQITVFVPALSDP